MQKITGEKLNILVAGEYTNIKNITSSRFLNKLYTTCDIESHGVINVKFNTFRDLAAKCKALQIDLVIVTDSKLLEEGITDVLRSNYINCIGPNSKWSELSNFDKNTRNLLRRYDINLPQETKIPSDFPLALCGNNICIPVNSVQETIDAGNRIKERSQEIAKSLYLVKLPEGENIQITSLYDGKNLLTFIPENTNKSLTEYSDKLKTLLNSEKADFTGFINSDLILSDDKLYLTKLNFDFKTPSSDNDLLYILWLAIFQKLNEIYL